MGRDGTYSYDDESMPSFPLDPPQPWPQMMAKMREATGSQGRSEPPLPPCDLPPPIPTPASAGVPRVGPVPPLPVPGCDQSDQRDGADVEFDPSMLLAKEFLGRPQEEIANHYGFERGANGWLLAHGLKDALSVPDGLLQMRGLDSTAKLVYSCMVRVAVNPNDACYASQKYIATTLGLERSVIGHAIRRLKKARLIEEIHWKKAHSIARGLHQSWPTNRKMYKLLFHPLLKPKDPSGNSKKSRESR